MDNEVLLSVTWNVMSTRSGSLGVPASPSDFRILATIPDGPAALPDAILQMAVVFDSLRFSTGFSQTGPPDSTEIQQIFIMLFFNFLV